MILSLSIYIACLLFSVLRVLYITFYKYKKYRGDRHLISNLFDSVLKMLGIIPTPNQIQNGTGLWNPTVVGTLLSCHNVTLAKSFKLLKNGFVEDFGHPFLQFL